MTAKSGGLRTKLGCKDTHQQEGDCLAGDRMIILCRKPRGWRTSKIESSSHHFFQCSARENVLARLEIGYTNIRK